MRPERVLDREIQVWGTGDSEAGTPPRFARVVYVQLPGSPAQTFIFDRGPDNATIDSGPEFCCDGRLDDAAIVAIVQARWAGYFAGRRAGRAEVAARMVALFDALRATAAGGGPL